MSKPDDILIAAEKYIAENGTEAFEQIIHRVCLLTIIYMNVRSDMLIMLHIPFDS